MQACLPNGILSYSAGSSDLDPYRFRKIGSADDRLALLMQRLPELREFVKTRKPLVVNCYPASLGTFQDVPFVDTYLRLPNFSRAMLLARQEDRSACILGQPLLVMDFFVQHLNKGLGLPANLVLFVGGYPMPSSAEHFLRNLVNSASAQSLCYHAYGFAEVDYAILIGKRMPDFIVHYWPAHHSVQASITGSQLTFALPDGSTVVSEDHATYLGDGAIQITNSADRISPAFYDMLEKWGPKEWARRTGYGASVNGKPLFQLRIGFQPTSDEEISHFPAWDLFKSHWTEKPKWNEIA